MCIAGNAEQPGERLFVSFSLSLFHPALSLSLPYSLCLCLLLLLTNTMWPLIGGGTWSSVIQIDCVLMVARVNGCVPFPGKQVRVDLSELWCHGLSFSLLLVHRTGIRFFMCFSDFAFHHLFASSSSNGTSNDTEVHLAIAKETRQCITERNEDTFT